MPLDHVAGRSRALFIEQLARRGVISPGLAQVLAIAGGPQKRETYGGTEFLIYPTGAANSSLDFIPIATVNGRVTGIGRNVYDNVVRSAAQSDLKAAKK